MKKYASTVALIFAFALFCMELSGCHSLGPLGTTMGLPLVEAVAFVRDDGELYIDIQDRQKYRFNKFYYFSVTLMKDQRPSKTYWSMSASADLQEKVIIDIDDFPLRYGEYVPGNKVEMPPMKIENGIYTINGYGYRFNEKNGLEQIAYRGKFSYENGVVNNSK